MATSASSSATGTWTRSARFAPKTRSQISTREICATALSLQSFHGPSSGFAYESIAEVDAAAKAGVLAPCDVELPMGPTGLDPSSTNFFQVLNIPTKIVKGSIELTAAVKVCNVGQKVSASQAVLLAKMGIKPFSYGMKVVSVFDSGSLFDAAVLDITDDKVVSMFMGGVANIAALSREIGVPTEASMPHAVSAALKNMAALCADIDFTFPEIQPLKDFLADPTAFAAAAASAAPAAGGGGAAKAEAAAAPAQEEEEEEDMDFDLFG